MKLFVCIIIFSIYCYGQQVKSVTFSPKGGCADTLIHNIDRATKSIYVSIYVLSYKPISDALIKAHHRKVDVNVILDPGNSRYVPASELVADSIAVWEDNSHAIFHNKFTVIDGQIVITGSFNYSASAELRNAENLIIISSAKTAAAYLYNWSLHQHHSIKW